MNKFIQAVKDLDLHSVEDFLKKNPKWIEWAEADGKNALHYLCAVPIAKFPGKEADSLRTLQLFLKLGMDRNSIQKIPGECDAFPATPLWYAYTRGRNEKLFNYLLKIGADPQNCMYAIAWYDDIKSAELFKKFGARIDDHSNGDSPFLAAINWKKFKMVEWLLKNGADVNIKDAKGNTAMFYAVKKKYPKNVIELLEKYSV